MSIRTEARFSCYSAYCWCSLLECQRVRSAAKSLHGAISRARRFAVHSHLGKVGDFADPRSRFARLAKLLDLFLGEVLDADKCVLRGARADEFVKLCLYGRAIPILGILNQEYHEK